MKQETITKMECWINQFPEAPHPNDDERFYEFVNSVVENEQGYLDYAVFEKAVKDAKRKGGCGITNVEEFCEEKEILIEHILNFVRYRQKLRE